MLKKYRKTLLLTSLVILLPIAVGLVLWNELPATMNIHWNAAGEVDGTAGKTFAVFFPALFMLAMHWFCVFMTHITNKDIDQNSKTMKLVFWMMPVLSNVVTGAMYAASLGLEINMSKIIFAPMGILFIVIGNFMPKVRRNSTLGIKTTWSLADDENWYATHRFAGKVWVFGGVLAVALSFLPTKWAISALFILIALLAFAPVIYSWRFYKKQQTAGKEAKTCSSTMSKWVWLFPAILIPALVIVLFTGSITFKFSPYALTVDSTFWTSITVDYADIDSVELREGNAPGSRDWGYGSARLLLGGFSSEELGRYTRYTYTFSDSYVVITAGNNTLVIADIDPEHTQLLYNNLCRNMG